MSHNSTKSSHSLHNLMDLVRVMSRMELCKMGNTIFKKLQLTIQAESLTRQKYWPFFRIRP